MTYDRYIRFLMERIVKNNISKKVFFKLGNKYNNFFKNDKIDYTLYVCIKQKSDQKQKKI